MESERTMQDNYKTRMIIEYVELNSRIHKLIKAIDKIKRGDFIPDTPLEILKRQLSEMIAYRNTLKVRGYYEQVPLYEYDNIIV